MSDSYTLFIPFYNSFMRIFCGTFLTRNLIHKQKQNAYTIQALLLTAIFGAMNIISSNDFLTLLVSVELLSFPTYFFDSL